MLEDDEYSWLEMLVEEQDDDLDFDFDFDVDEESSTVTPDGKDVVLNANMKKRRIRDRRRIYAPRIVKKDIRRQYATMFANVYNTLDPSTIASFFKTFAIPHMRVRKTAYLIIPTSASFQSSFPLKAIGDIGGCGRGLQWMVIFFSVLKYLCPDITMRIVSSQLLTRSDTSKTLLTMKIRVDFTRLHDVNPFLFTEGMFASASAAQPTASCAGHSGMLPSDHTGRSEVSPAVYFKEKVGSDIPMLRAPESIAFTSILRIYIDEFKRIEMFEFVGVQSG
jgi:hypothetical protein